MDDCRRETAHRYATNQTFLSHWDLSTTTLFLPQLAVQTALLVPSSAYQSAAHHQPSQQCLIHTP